jgi:NAD(P)-dependent dehydrogenase (short-subunit alcohol dehydrogenase family)
MSEARQGRLHGKVAMITGAGAGIGRVAAGLFAREGARVVVAELDEELGASVVQEIRADGGEALFCRTDVGEREQVARAVATAVESFGKLDVL